MSGEALEAGISSPYLELSPRVQDRRTCPPSLPSYDSMRTVIFEIRFTSSLLNSFPNPILKHTSLILAIPQESWSDCIVFSGNDDCYDTVIFLEYNRIFHAKKQNKGSMPTIWHHPPLYIPPNSNFLYFWPPSHTQPSLTLL